MTKRRLVLRVGFLIVLAAACLVAVSLKPPMHKINQETVKLIKKGMTKAEVEALLGKPPGDYSKKPGGRWIEQPVNHASRGPSQGKPETWKGDHVMVTVIFNPTVADEPTVWLRQDSP